MFSYFPEGSGYNATTARFTLACRLQWYGVCQRLTLAAGVGGLIFEHASSGAPDGPVLRVTLGNGA